MAKDGWHQKIKPEVKDAWARFDRVVGGSPLPSDIVSESRSLADARRIPWTRKKKKKKPHNKAPKQKRQPPQRSKRNRSKPVKQGKRLWVENYADYLKSPHWKAKRKEALEYHGRKCHDCGATQGLEVHHLTYKGLGREKMRDLQVLCGDCHAIRHEDKPGVVTTDYLSEQFRAIIG